MIEDHELPNIEITKDSTKEDVLKVGSVCNRAGHCCKYGAGYILDEEIKPIAEKLKVTEVEFKEKYTVEHKRFNTDARRFCINKIEERPYGPCVFLDEKNNACMIHDVKPLYCKITNCSSKGRHLQQWFDVNHYVNVDDAQSLREWAVVCDQQKDIIKGGHVKDMVSKQRLKDIRKYVDLQPKRVEPEDDDEFVDVKL